MSTADTLRKAADVLEEVAEKATPGPWEYRYKNTITPARPIEITEADWGPDGHDEMRVTTNEGQGAWRVEDVQYMALVDPTVGKALAKSLRLRAAATDMANIKYRDDSPPPGSALAADLDLARAILREGQS